MEAAIDWMVTLRSGHAKPAEWARFERWRAADAAHAAAWQRLTERLEQPAQALAQIDRQLPGQGAQVRQLLARPPRRAVLRAVLLAVTGGGTAALTADRFAPLATLMADVQTRTGERRSFTLPDTSRLTLNARSAADLAFAAAQPQVLLRSGQAIAEARSGALLCLRAPGCALYGTGRWYAGHADGRTQVVALRGALRVVDAAGGEHTLAPGQGGVLDAAGRPTGARIAASAADWERGYLTAAPLPLGDVVAALQRYTPAVLHVADTAARLMVHASLPLDDVARSLRALEDTLPIRIRRLGPWVAHIDTPPTA